jgi:pimeloyl-ACP methyl ester carboxylesterase
VKPSSPTLSRDGVLLAYEEAGTGDPPLVLVHGIACHRGFWEHQIKHFARHHRVLAVDLRGHGDSDAPADGYAMAELADDVAWMCSQLGIVEPVVVGHSLGGLVALQMGSGRANPIRGAVLIDPILVPETDRADVIPELVADLRGTDPIRVLRDYFAAFFGAHDDDRRMAWILEQASRTPPHVTSAVWEQSVRSWDDADALRRCTSPLLYLDAGTPNADLARAAALKPGLVIGRTVGSGHFSQMEVPDQVNAMIERFIAVEIAPASGARGQAAR